MVKVVGGCVILFCCAGYGVVSAWELRQHERELHVLKQAIYLLRGEIRHGRSPLPEAFAALGERVEAPFGNFFGQLSERLREGAGKTLGILWEEEMKEQLNGSALKPEEKEAFLRLGQSLGYLDLEMQLASLELYLEQLEEDRKRALKELLPKQKLYRSLGLAGGAFLVILLF